MFDKYVIGENGFRNVAEGGKIIGFQLEVRIAYYRGLGLSMIEGFDVTVDGRQFPREENLFTVRGRTFTYKQMETEYNERWEMGEVAQLTVPLAGGLTHGPHEVSVVEILRVSYVPVLTTGKDKKTLTLQGEG
jgi:hypothetical protein